MKQSMKKKLVAVSVTAATLMGSMMFAGNAAAQTDAQFNMALNVVSSNDCKLNIDLPDATGSEFKATWVKQGTNPASVSLDADSAASTDAVIGISLDPTSPADCVMNSTALDTVSQVGSPSGVGAVVISMQDGAHWRFTPMLANVKLYNDASYASEAPGTVKMVGASGANINISKNIINGGTRGTVGNASTTFFGTKQAIPFINAADMYTSTSALLISGGLSGRVLVNADAAAGDIKSAKYYIGGYIGGSPTDAVGNINDSLAVNGDVANFPFVVTVSTS
ncbi:hypothetical protein [Enterobacter hormaechei]|uniref:hypothetical protein n=1 Tax=Enterobacter hormaechei TaxID=158836 RepID=UPI0032DB7278